MFNEKKRGVPWAALLIAAILFTSGVGVGVLATPPASNGIWSGNWIREAYAYFTSGLQLPFLTAGRVTYAGAGGNLTDSASMTFSASKGLYAVPWMNTTNSKVSSLTAGRPVISGLGGILATDAGLTYDAATDTLTATNISTGQLTDSGLTSGRVVLAGAGGLLGDDGGFLYNSVTNTATLGNLTVTNRDLWQQPTSYTITISGGTTYATNGATGKIDYSGADASTVIQSAITASDGKTILIKSGLYTLTTKILVNKPAISIIGEGIYDTGYAGRGTTLLYTGADGAIQFGDDTAYFYYQQLKNIQIRCSNNSALYGVRVYGSQYFYAENVIVTHTTTTNSMIAYLLESTTNNRQQVSGLYINISSNSVKYGIVLLKSGTSRVNNNIFFGGTFRGANITGGIGFSIGDGNQGDTNVLNCVTITNFKTHISIGTGNYAHQFLRVRMETGDTGIIVAGNDNVFRDCSIATTTTVIDTGLRNAFNNNYGYVTENKGTVATTAKVATKAVTHGLAYTPTAGDIMLTPQTSTFNCTSYAITAYSSTTFTITTYDATGTAKGASSAITFIWKAQK